MTFIAYEKNKQYLYAMNRFIKFSDEKRGAETTYQHLENQERQHLGEVSGVSISLVLLLFQPYNFQMLLLLLFFSKLFDSIKLFICYI